MKNKLINLTKIVAPAACCLLLALQAIANRPDTANPYFEINRLIGVMANTNYISFNASYYYESSNTAGIIRDTLAGSYKIHGKIMFATLDSNIIVQNDSYNLFVNKTDSLIVIGRTKTVFPVVMNTDVLDANLQGVYVAGIVLTDSATTRKIKFTFKTMSPYASYELVYDTITYRTHSISYRFKHYGAEAGNSNYYTGVKAVFTNYQTGIFTDSVFDIETFVKRVNGVFVAQPLYNRYEIINQVLKQ